MLFLHDCKQTFHMSLVRINQKVLAVIKQNLGHLFLCEDKNTVDFQICISVPLRFTLDHHLDSSFYIT